MNPMGSKSIDGLRNKGCFSHGYVGVSLEKPQDKRASNTDIEDKVSATMLRYELLLGIVVSCEGCSSTFREKIAESSGLEEIL
jgi:hypothetical protein